MPSALRRTGASQARFFLPSSDLPPPGAPIGLPGTGTLAQHGRVGTPIPADTRDPQPSGRWERTHPRSLGVNDHKSLVECQIRVVQKREHAVNQFARMQRGKPEIV